MVLMEQTEMTGQLVLLEPLATKESKVQKVILVLQVPMEQTEMTGQLVLQAQQEPTV